MKFRAWHNIRKCWLSDIIVCGDGSWSGRIGDIEGYTTDCVLEQSTGLSDINGKEIYCNDLVKAPNGAVGLIEYITDELNSGFEIKLISGPDYSFDDYMGRKVSFGEMEIIGNVHDNPELLENL